MHMVMSGVSHLVCEVEGGEGGGQVLLGHDAGQSRRAVRAHTAARTTRPEYTHTCMVSQPLCPLAVPTLDDDPLPLFPCPSVSRDMQASSPYCHGRGRRPVSWLCECDMSPLLPIVMASGCVGASPALVPGPEDGLGQQQRHLVLARGAEALERQSDVRQLQEGRGEESAAQRQGAQEASQWLD